MLRLLLRTWAAVLILVLLAVTGLTAYQMWRGGIFLALSLLPQLVTNLILIAAVLAVRHVIYLWQSGAIKQSLLEGLMQGQTALRSTVQGAKGTLSSLGKEVKEELGELVAGAKVTQATGLGSGPRCPSCNRPIAPGARFCDGCGAALPTRCPSCGRMANVGARFCDGCGASLGTAK